MVSAAPVRTPEQRAEALARALESRQEKARLRRALRERAISPVTVILGAAENPLWGSFRVSWLLESVPGIGPARAERLMDRLGIARSRRIQGLGERQRAAVIEQFGGVS